jgi:hypothetical protein
MNSQLINNIYKRMNIRTKGRERARKRPRNLINQNGVEKKGD